MITLGFPPSTNRHAISGTIRAYVSLPGKSANSGMPRKIAARMPLALIHDPWSNLRAGQ